MSPAAVEPSEDRPGLYGRVRGFFDERLGLQSVEALAEKKLVPVQRALETEHKATGTTDGYVYEEIAENLALLGRNEEARPYFELAYLELGKDDWFVKNEPERLANLKKRAGRTV